MPKARVNGIEIHYQDSGEGYPVLLIHGFNGNLGDWRFQAPALRGELRVIAIDQRGHGSSEKPMEREDYSLELMAEDAFGLLEHLGIGECCLVGHSMGGMVAQHLALAHPERLRALVMVDSAAEPLDSVRSEEPARLYEIARDEGMEAVFEEQLRTSPAADQLRAQPRLLEMWRQRVLSTSREAYMYCGEAMARREPLLDKLSAIAAPTLIVCGENDELFLEPSRRMHERMPGSELVIIPGAAHMPQAEKAGQFNRALIEFLSRVRRRVAAGG